MAEAPRVMVSEPVYADGEPVGHITSAAYGYTTGRNIAYAWLPAELGIAGTEVDIERFGARIPTVVTEESLSTPR